MMRWLKKQKGDQKDIKDLFKYNDNVQVSIG